MDPAEVVARLELPAESILYSDDEAVSGAVAALERGFRQGGWTPVSRTTVTDAMGGQIDGQSYQRNGLVRSMFWQIFLVDMFDPASHVAYVIIRVSTQHYFPACTGPG